MNFTTLLTGIDFSRPTWDIFILLFFLIVAVIYGLSLGRDRIALILVSIYMALAVVTTVPYLVSYSATVTPSQAFAFHVVLFLGLFLVIFFLLARSGLMKMMGGTLGGWWQVTLFSLLHVGLLISVVLSFLPQEILDHLAVITRTIFVSELARSIWLVAPILAMALAGDEKKRA